MELAGEHSPGCQSSLSGSGLVSGAFEGKRMSSIAEARKSWRGSQPCWQRWGGGLGRSGETRVPPQREDATRALLRKVSLPAKCTMD